MSGNIVSRSDDRATDRDQAVLRMCVVVEQLRQRAATQRLVAQELNARAASLELRANAIAKRAVDLRSSRSKRRDRAQ